MEERFRKKAEKRGIKVGSLVILDGDTNHVYRVTDMYMSNRIPGQNELLAYLSASRCSISWNANSPRLTVYEESDENEPNI